MKKIEISSATLNAIKNLLFANDGVNIKPLVEDLKVGETNEDLLAINVALVMQGAKPEICEKAVIVHMTACFIVMTLFLIV